MLLKIPKSRPKGLLFVTAGASPHPTVVGQSRTPVPTQKHIVSLVGVDALIDPFGESSVLWDDVGFVPYEQIQSSATFTGIQRGNIDNV